MLGRNLTSRAGFVCLRCRLQLAGTARRIPPRAVALSPLRYHLRSNATGGRPAPDNELNEVDDIDGLPDDEEKLGTEYIQERKAEEDAVKKYYEELERLRRAGPRAYHSRGHRLKPQPEDLSYGMLGKPATALVMREKGAWKKPQYPELSPVSVQVDAASLMANEAPDAEADVLIHQMMPRDTALTETEFRELKDNLVDGFTAHQLESYLREFQAVRRLLPEEPASEDPPWILERVPWAPGSGEMAHYVEPHLAGYVSQHTPNKEKLAIRVIRECWGVSSLQAIDQQDGEISARLRDVELTLLLRNKRLLGTLSRSFPGMQIQIFGSTQFITIRAPKAAAEAILERVNGFLRQAQTVEFAAGLVSPHPIEPAMLDEVGRLTNSVPRLDSSGEKVVVTWIHLSDRDPNWENYGETVLRLLRSVCSPKTRTSSALEVVPASLARHGRYLAEVNCHQKLPWQERLNGWERWIAAIPQSSFPQEASPQALIPPNLLPLALDPTQAIKEPEERVGSKLGWSSTLQTDTAAVFGHVVFARPKQPASSAEQPERELQLDISRPRTFIPFLPPLLSLDFPSNLRETGLWHTMIVIRFMPDPEMPPDLVESAPDLELRIEADNREIKRVISLRALVHTFTGDVLLPSCPVDARISQQCYYTLLGKDIDQHATPIFADFLSKADLRPWAGKLNTPHHLKDLHLPRRLLSPFSIPSTPRFSSPTINTTDGPTEDTVPATEEATEDTNTIPEAADAPAEATSEHASKRSLRSATEPQDSDSDSDLVTLNYRFAGIELHRTVTAEYDGFKLRYTNVEAGLRGGRRAELSLDAVPVEPPSESSGTEGTEGTEGRGGGGGGGQDSPLDGKKNEQPQPQPQHKFVDNTFSWASFTTHVMNMTTAKDQARLLGPKPLNVEDFLRAASGIANETGNLKWHIKE